MKKIYPGDDFTIKLPDYLGGKSLPTGSSVSMKIFTINQSESYSLTITQNPLPKNIELSSDVLIYMTSGVIQGMVTVNIPDSGMDDSFYNYTRILTTDLFWVNSNAAGESLEELNNKINALDASVHSNYYTRTETENLLDLLWSDVAATYVDDSELFTVVDELDSSVKSNYYDKPTIDNMLENIDASVDLSDYYNKSAVDGLISDLDSSVKDNYYTKGTIELNFATKTYLRQALLQYDYIIDSRVTSLDSSVRNNYYTKSQIDSSYYVKSDIDTSISGNYYNKTSVDGFISGIDSSVSTNYYNKSQIDASIGSIQTALNSIIND